MINWRTLALAIITLFSLFACKRTIERPNYDVDIIAPLLQTSLSIADIIKDTTNFKTNSDKSISLVYTQKLDSVGLNVLDTFSAKPFERTAKLNSLVLDEVKDSINVTLGQLAKQIPGGGLLVFFHGSRANVPENNGLQIGPSTIDLKQYFETVTLRKGEMGISIFNGFPVAMRNVNLIITNVDNREVVVDTTFLLIPPKSTVVGNIGLAGKTIEGLLEANVKLDLAAGNNVLNDTNDYVRAIMTVRDLDVQEATAIFPAQSVIKDTIDIELENMGNRELDFVVLEEGKVRIVANSTLEDIVYFTYSLPGVYAPGSTTSFSVSNEIGPAPPNGSVPGVWEYDFSGYRLDLRGQNGNSHNKLFSDLEGRIRYTGKKVNLSLQDSFYVKIFTTGIKPKYARGYLGDTVVSISDTVAVTAFEKIPAGNINFEQATISIDIENELGLGGKININNITAINASHTPSRVELTDNNVIGKDLLIAAATDNPFKSEFSNVSTSNAAPIINIFPKTIFYKADVKVGDQVKSYDNFMYNGKFVKSTLNIEIPLAFKANGFELSDTVVLSPTFSSDLKNGTFTIAASNGFPLTADLKLIFLDQSGISIDSLTSTERLEPASVDPITRKVMKDLTNGYIKKTSRIGYRFDEAKLANIRAARRIIFKVKFYTLADGSSTKIFDDYTIDFKLIGDFKYGM